MATPSADTLLQDLVGLLEQEFEIPANAVTLDADLFEDLDLDSLDAVSLAARLEEETGIALDERDIKAMRTIASVIEIVQARLRERAGSPS